MARTRPSTTPHARALAQFCEAAVKRALIAGSVAAGCASRPNVLDPGHTRAESAPPPVATPAHEAVDNLPVPSRGPPLLTTDPPRVVSGFEAAAFPCATKEPSAAELEALAAADTLDRFYRERDRAEYEQRARGLKLAHDVDYIKIEQVAPMGAGVHLEGTRYIDAYKLVEAGVLCGGAQDHAACVARHSEARAAIEGTLPCDTEHCTRAFELVVAYTTRGDQVEAHAGKRALRALFGDIDTPVEAWLTLVAHGKKFGYVCDDRERTTQRRVGDEHELMGRTWTHTCRPLKEEFLTYRVTPRGHVRLVHKRVASLERGGCVVGGRRPAGLVELEPDERTSAAALLSQMAHLEAASIPAFARLAQALAALGAGRALLDRVERARRDEVRHARLMAKLARRYGARLTRPRIVPSAGRTPRALACENAVEGCVRELYGALVAGVQAERAADPALRAAFRELAGDETEHAALAWDVAAFLDTSLDDAARAEVRAARLAAHAELVAALSEPSEEQRTVCGLPSRREAELLAHELGLWLASQDTRVRADVQ